MAIKITAVALAAMATLGTAGLAFAGTCPPEHVLTEPRALENVAADKLSREVLANVKLIGWREMDGFILRMRRLELQPGGFVPTHTHEDRPSIVYIVKGTAIEHSTFCAVPIEHHAGDTTPEFGPGHGHWWENKGAEVVTFISTDVLPYTSDADPYVGFE